MRTAVHFGAGNIGRGFVGLLLHEAGYEVIFADVSAELVDALAAGRYAVHSVGAAGTTSEVTGVRALNSGSQAAELTAEIATADIVTTAVGPRVLPFLAPAIAAGLRARADSADRVAVMACENAVGATDTLRDAVSDELNPAERERVLARAVFANTAVDRIVPGQAADAGLDVTVEDYAEWVIESRAFEGAPPHIPGAHFVDELGPYIERKLFTVNTGHASVAYAGFVRGIPTIHEAMADEGVVATVLAALADTAAALVARHGLDPAELHSYQARIVERFRNPNLVDTVVRVGREPVRKLSRPERFIAPALAAAETGRTPTGLLDALANAYRFDVAQDPQSVELQALLRGESVTEIVRAVHGLEPGEPLVEELRRRIEAVRG